MQIKVGQLEEHLAKRQETAVTAALGSFAVTDDATTLTVTNGEARNFALDATANSALAKYLRVPPSYFDKLTPDFRATLLRYEFDRNKDAVTVIESLNDEIIAVHQPTQTMLPIHRVAEVVTKVLKPDDTIRRVVTDETHFHLDATTSAHSVNVLHDRPGYDPQVGDITEAGFRVLSYPFQHKAPSVGTYFERLACTNGMTTEEKVGRILLKGRTVDEVIVSMEEAAQAVLSQLDEQLSDYADTVSTAVPGSPQAFAAQLAREANVPRKVLDAVLDIINQLPEPVTVWDVNQAFTSVANEVNYATMMRLQAVGGHLALDAERMIERCHTCERLLPKT